MYLDRISSSQQGSETGDPVASVSSGSCLIVSTIFTHLWIGYSGRFGTFVFGLVRLPAEKLPGLIFIPRLQNGSQSYFFETRISEETCFWFHDSQVVFVKCTSCHACQEKRRELLGKALTVKKDEEKVSKRKLLASKSPPEKDAIETHFRCHCFSLHQLIPRITQLRSAARLISCWEINLFQSIGDYYLDSARWVYWWPLCVD